MKIPQEKKQKLAEYVFFMNRKANDCTPFTDLSEADKLSYLHEAEEEIAYINDRLEIIGASQEEIDKLVRNLAIHMEHSAKLMQENAELNAKISRRDVSVRELKGKQKEYLKHMDSILDGGESSEALKESEKKIRSLQEKNNTLVDEAKTSADMLEQLIPLQYENKKLIEERDSLAMVLNQIQQKQMKENPTTASDDADRAKVSAFLQLHGVKDGMKLISSALGESNVGQAKASAKNWITIYEKRHGMEALLKACDSI